MLSLGAVGEHHRSSLIVKPEVILKSSPEGNEWTWKLSCLAGHQEKG